MKYCPTCRKTDKPSRSKTKMYSDNNFKTLLRKATFLLLFLLSWEMTNAYPSVSREDSLFLITFRQEIDSLHDPAPKVIKYYKSFKDLKNLNKEVAVNIMKEGLHLAQDIDHSQGIGELSWQIGYTYQLIGQFDSAERYIRRSVSTARKNNLGVLEDKAMNRLGSFFFRTGETDSAVNAYRYLLEHSVSINNKDGEMMALAALGKVEKNQGNYDKALEYFISSLEIAKMEEAQNSMGHALMNMGIIYSKTKDFENGKNAFLQALKLALDYNEQDRVQDLYNNLGVLNRLTQDFDSAIYYQKLGLNIAIESGNRNDISYSYMNMGTTRAYQKDFENAAIFYNSAFHYAKKSKNRQLKLSVLQNLSAVNKDLGNYKNALNYGFQSLEIADQMKQRYNLPDIYENISEAFKGQGKYDSAFKYYKISRLYHDSIFNEQKSKNIEELKVRYDSQKQKEEMLVLSNENLENKVKLSAKKLQLNTLMGSSFTIIVVITLLWINARNKRRKDSIIKEQQIEKLRNEKEILSAQALIAGQEQERKRIAQELHDGVGVLLSTASIYFSNLQENLGGSDKSEMAVKAKELLNKAGTEVRKVSQNMMPGTLSRFGLVAALEDLFDELEDCEKYQLDCSIEQLDYRLPENMEIMIYRIVQEMINNTLKHADGDKVSFTFARKNAHILVDYSDNGKGFNPGDYRSDKSLGLSGIKSRVDFLKGRLKINTHPGKGCQYVIAVPVN